MKKLFICSFAALTTILYAQDKGYTYPQDQHPYKSGNAELFRDINTWLTTNSGKPCKENEMYWATLKIDATGNISLIRNKTDQLKAAQNKCAYDLLVGALGNLQGWKPAEINGKKVTSYFDFPFVARDYFDRYTEGYDITRDTKRARFPGGTEAFRKEVQKYVGGYVDFDSYTPEGVFEIVFSISETGAIENIDIEPKVANSRQLLEDIRFGMKKIKGKWEPATVHGKSISSKFRLPVKF